MINYKQCVYAALFFGMLIAVMAIYWPGLSGIFLVDDIYNLNTLNANGGVTDTGSFVAFVFGNNSGMLGRPVAMLSFLIDDQYYPGSVEKYRYTNLMIHCLCGILVVALARKLMLIATEKGHVFATQVALVAGFWWMVAPLNVSTTLYIIQRMTQLSTLFTLLGLLIFLYGRQKIEVSPTLGRLYVLFGLYACGLLAVLSKENGALIFCIALVLEISLANARHGKIDRFVLLAITIPLVVGAGYFTVKFNSLTHSSVRDFTAVERLLTESRILWDYLAKIILPISGKMGLVHDDVVISRGLFEPITTILSVLSHFILVCFSIYFRRKLPFLFLAVFGFYACHLLESTVIPLELYFEHRNYTAAVFVCIGLTAMVWPVAKYGSLIKGCVATLLCIFSAVCFQRTQIWGNPKAQIAIWAQEHPESVRAQTMYARSLIAEKHYSQAEVELKRLQKKWPDMIHNDIVILNHACVGKMQLNMTVSQLYQKLESGTYDGSLPSILEETFRLYKTDVCALIDASLMDGIFSRVTQLKNTAHTFKAKVAFWEFELHARNGDLDGALEALDRTFVYQKDSYVLYLKSAVFNSAGLHENALEEIDKAIAIETEKNILLRQHMSEYLLLKNAIFEKISKN